MNSNETIYYTPKLLTPIDGFIQTTVPQKYRERILNEIQKSESSMNNNLIGHIKNQLALTNLEEDKEWFAYIKQVCEAFSIQFEASTKVTSDFLGNESFIDYLTLDTPWVNKMKKTEFNPYHNHRGVYSYVIWVKIPYDLEEEKKYFPDPNLILTSTFSFMVACDRGLVQHPIHVDKSYEWELILFPATLWHCVYPFFTSDQERISVAGNVLYKLKK